MAEEKQQKSAAQTAQTAVGKAKDAAKLAKDIGRIAAGDLSAVKDVLMNKLVWEIVGVVLGLIAIVGLVIGAALTGVIEFIAQSWSRNWAENWEYQGIISQGNLDYLQTTGWLLTLGNTVLDFTSDIITAATSLFDSNAMANIMDTNANHNHNGNLDDDELVDAGYTPTEDTYKNTIEAIYTNEDGQLDSAITERLDMIKGRVRQRGLQIKKAVENQYLKNKSLFGEDSAYTKIAEILDDKMKSQYVDEDGNYVLYAGFNQDLSVVNFDTSAFELTDLQALKILAIFSIQYDCQLTEIDMWSLMNYCGWYTGNETGELDDVAEGSIYDLSQSQTFGSNIGSVTFDGMPILSYELPSLKVPIWSGSCAPQWYYEELAAIREHNKNSEDQWGVDADTALASYTYTGEIKPTVITDFGSVTIERTYRYILYEDSGGYYISSSYLGGTSYIPNCDKAVKSYDSPNYNQTLTFDGLMPGTYYELKVVSYTQQINKDGSRGEKIRGSETTVDSFTAKLLGEWTDSEIYGFSNISSVKTFGIIDKLFYAGENNIVIKRSDYSSYRNWTKSEISNLGADIYDAWEEYVWGVSKSVSGGVVSRSTYGNHSFRYTKSISAPKTTSTINPFTKNVTVKEYSYGIGLYKSSNKNYIDYIGYGDSTRTFTGLQGNTQYYIYELTTTVTKVYDEEGNLLSTSEETTKGFWSKCSFTTFQNTRNLNAYEMYVEVNLSFKARSVDEIAFEILGIWPDSLNNYDKVVRETANGNLIGQNSFDEDKYSFCLMGGFYKQTYGDETSTSIYLPLQRSYSETNDSMPYVVTKYIYEYGITTRGGLGSYESVPRGGWQQIAEDGDHLIFEINGSVHYLVYCRVTVEITTLYEDGHTNVETQKGLFIIDEIHPDDYRGTCIPDTVVEDGAEYAAEHLGNELLLRSWTDIYQYRIPGESGSHSVPGIRFEREDGYQYEAYVDMVMALAKLLDIDYSDWDEAMKRAEELGISKSGG